MTRRASVVLMVALLVAGAAAARAGGDPRRCAPASEQRMGSDQRAFVALVRRSARAYARPGGRVMRRFGHIGVDGAPQVFAVLGRVVDAECATRWLHVQ